MEEIIQQCFPPEMYEELSTFFILKKTPLYDQLRLGEIKFGLFTFQYNSYEKSGNPDGMSNPFGEGSVDNEYDGDFSETSCDSDVTIIDDDMPNYYDYRLVISTSSQFLHFIEIDVHV